VSLNVCKIIKNGAVTTYTIQRKRRQL